ncbi:MAG: hypothetical protein WCF25_08840, partial [Acidimicrobiales bacterium]
LVDDSLRGLGIELSDRYDLTVLVTRVHGLFGNLYLNLSRGFEEALTQPFRILVRLDTDALIAGSDFERSAKVCFESNLQLGSLGSFRIGYNRIGVRDRRWAKRQILKTLLTQSVARPRRALTIAHLVLRARRNGYKLGDGIMGGAAVYRYEAVRALDQAGLLGRTELAATGLHEDYIFGLCLFAIGYQLGEFGDRFDDLPMGVDWIGLPASPAELMRLGKSIIHSTRSFGDMDEEAIRREFRFAREER